MVATADRAPICRGGTRRRRTCGAIRGLDHRGVVDAEAGVNVPRSDFRVPTAVYAELHCHSALSFIDGALLTEQLTLTAAPLGYTRLELTGPNAHYEASVRRRRCEHDVRRHSNRLGVDIRQIHYH